MLLIKLFLVSLSITSDYENKLRKKIFNNYSNDIIPKINNNPLNVEMGLAVQTLEEFNQKVESIELNIWVRMNWNDSRLEWNTLNYNNISFIAVKPNMIWHPDIELYNAASLPEIYNLNDAAMLYNRGEIMWSRPGIYRFSCPLDLHNFPFDTQICKFTFGSWIYTNNDLNLRSYLDESKAVDILSGFSHSEWNVISIDYEKEKFNNKTLINYFIKLERLTHYYSLSMGMTITLVFVSFIIMCLPSDNVSRTSTAVFIPLTILALQLTIVDKVPVVGYFTIMDKFFLSCFISSMFVSIESGIIFALLSIRSKKILDYINNIKYLNIKKIKKPTEEIDLNNIGNEENNNTDNNLVRSSSYRSAIINKDLYSNKIYRIINHDDKHLYLTEDNEITIDYINKKLFYIDNFFRFMIPLVYSIYIGVILN
jgi:hypothetical protein